MGDYDISGPHSAADAVSNPVDEIDASWEIDLYAVSREDDDMTKALCTGIGEDTDLEIDYTLGVPSAHAWKDAHDNSRAPYCYVPADSHGGGGAQVTSSARRGSSLRDKISVVYSNNNQPARPVDANQTGQTGKRRNIDWAALQAFARRHRLAGTTIAELTPTQLEAIRTLAPAAIFDVFEPSLSAGGPGEKTNWVSALYELIEASGGSLGAEFTFEARGRGGFRASATLRLGADLSETVPPALPNTTAAHSKPDVPAVSTSDIQPGLQVTLAALTFSRRKADSKQCAAKQALLWLRQVGIPTRLEQLRQEAKQGSRPKLPKKRRTADTGRGLEELGQLEIGRADVSEALAPAAAGGRGPKRARTAVFAGLTDEA